MSARTSYTSGTFSWVDQTTPDQEAAKRFYAGLLGWDTQDHPVGEGAVYTMAHLGGTPVAALSPQPPQQRDAGVPPLWNSYITVDSIEATVAAVTEHGGHVHAAPFDVFGFGRMAVCQDPQGVFFMPWEARSHIGAGLVNAPGALCWNDLGTPDPQDAMRFYAAVFGWTFAKFENSPTDYWIIRRADGGTNGGLHPADEPTGWLVYFACADLDASIARAGELGGGKLEGPIDLGMARMAVMRDPQGGVFALYAGRLED